MGAFLAILVATFLASLILVAALSSGLAFHRATPFTASVAAVSGRGATVVPVVRDLVERVCLSVRLNMMRPRGLWIPSAYCAVGFRAKILIYT